MNIIEARERTRIGGKYRRKDVDWCLIKKDRGHDLVECADGTIVFGRIDTFNIFAADDWAPDPGDEEKCPCFFCQRERGEQTGEEGPAICMDNPDPIDRPFKMFRLEPEWKADIACKMAELTKRVMHLEEQDRRCDRAFVKVCGEVRKIEKDISNHKHYISPAEPTCPVCHEAVTVDGCSCYRKLLAEVQSLRGDKYMYDNLILAVQHKFDGETRYDTALRYITERENRIGTDASHINTDHWEKKP